MTKLIETYRLKQNFYKFLLETKITSGELSTMIISDLEYLHSSITRANITRVTNNKL